MDDVRFWVIHHVGSGITPDPTPEQTAKFHMEANGWPGIGYHWVISRNGDIYMTNPMTVMSYHVAGRNKECVGILLNGNFIRGRTPTQEQIESLTKLLRWLDYKYPHRVVTRHKDVALPEYPTSCPGDWGYEKLQIWTKD